jgi:hypothetical protein
MANWALYVFLFILTLLGGVLGLGLHYWRANFSLYPENLSDNSLIDGLMSNHDMVFEKHIIEAKWDDNGYWDLYSSRNMIYYVVSGAAAPLILAVVDWKVIKILGDGFCTFMVAHGNNSLLCY